MHHIMTGEWAVLEEASYIDCLPLYKLAKSRKLTPYTIPVDTISHKPLEDISLTSRRYILADIAQPSILCLGMQNPHGKLYRMLDGRHRLLKRINQGITSSLSYVLPVEDVARFIRT